MSALNEFVDVSAKLQEGTGQIRIASKVAGGALTISDTSGLLSTFGFEEGPVNGFSGGETVVIRRETVTTSNARTITRSVSVEVEKLNDVLAQFRALQDLTPRQIDEAVAGINGAIDALGGLAQGISLSQNEADLRLSILTRKNSSRT